MKRIFSSGLILSFFILFTKVGFAQTSYTVLVGPGGQFVFEPVNLTISTRDTVIWEWQSDNHTTTSDITSGDEVWDSGIQNNGTTFSKVFVTLGSYAYHCTPHQAFGMTGTIIVEGLIGIDNHSAVIANKIVLNQNYPNPFNPSSIISYSLAKSEFVTLQIYDIFGKEVRTLVNQTQEAGYKTVIWNSTNNHGKSVSAGVYLYQIRAGEFVQTKKMLLLK
ncbi:MAG: T9SS type A sorting domain-containing protein [Candidatus Marinimicrobia bacterium]|nr:T9SS type A sorting domain-containing protein [Candidatus Neomarinimicrobiota bacterium]